MVLLYNVVEKLADEWRAKKQALMLDRLKSFLMVSQAACSYAEAAGALGMDEGTVRVAVHRLRKRYRQVLRDEITQTLADPAQAEEELRTLFDAFRSG